MRPAKLYPITLAALAIGCAGEAPAPEEYPDSVAADPGHYSLEFENDAVRVLRVSYGAGESSVMHEHPAHCAIALSDGNWRMPDAEGAVTEVAQTSGEITCFEPVVHNPENASTEASDVILVEFKEGATAGSWTSEYPDAVIADPDHYSVEFENDVARLIRIRYGPGETSVMHSHAANCAIFLTSQMGTFETPEGEVLEVPFEVGQLQCTDAEAHRPTNTSEEALEVVLLELKGRAAFQN